LGLLYGSSSDPGKLGSWVCCMGLQMLDIDLDGANLGGIYRRWGLGHMARLDTWHTGVKTYASTLHVRQLCL